MSQVVCLNGHDVTGVEGFTCPSCSAEVRTVLSPVPIGIGARPLHLMVLGAVLLSLVIGMVVALPGGITPLTATIIFLMATGGAALWLAGCFRIALAIVRSADATGMTAPWPPRGASAQ